MLTSLYVKNYAIIDEIEIVFDNGYNVITGETGAGKSILLGALGLIMGQRSDSKVLYHTDSKCIVEANFTVLAHQMKNLPTSEEYDIETQINLRREINTNGKSRAFINDSLVKLSTLRALSTALVEIHNQFDSLSIMDEAYQLGVVDALAGSGAILEIYAGQYTEYSALRAQLETLKRQKEKSQVDLDYHLFQLEELEKIPLDEMDQESMEEEYKTLENSEEIKRILLHIMNESTEVEHSIENRLIELSREMHSISGLSSSIDNIEQQIDGLIENLRDLGRNAQINLDGLNYSEARVFELRELMDHLYALQKKHHVNSVAGLIEIRDHIQMLTEGPENLEVRIAEVEKKFLFVSKDLKNTAELLSAKRKSGFDNICNNIQGLLQKMAMPNARVKIKHSLLNAFSDKGIDMVTLCFSANKGVPPKAVSDIASGGEISRLALCIKSLIAGEIKIGTLIFDEIDAGISGAVAIKVADILSSLSQNHQVITITHSPQVAAQAGRHLFVHKRDLEHRTVTEVSLLTKSERIQELAKMLSTDPPSVSAVSNARELLSMAHK